MGVRKQGKLFVAWVYDEKEENKLILGKYECKRCAEIAVLASQWCIPCCGIECHSPESIELVRRLDCLEVIEEHLGKKLTEEQAFYEDKKLIDGLVKHNVEKQLRKYAEKELKQKHYYIAKRIIHAVPICEIQYPAVQLTNAVLPTEDGEGIPEASGVYFVWNMGEVEYVGQSVNLNARARIHHEKIWASDLITWLEFPPSILNYAEAFYIGLCMPPRNFGRFQKLHEERELLSNNNIILSPPSAHPAS